MRFAARSAFVTLLALSAAACSTAPAPPPPPPPPQVTVPPNAGIYKIGQPYQVDNVWYYPREQPDYDETGIASWYGPTFYGHHTANGEMYDGNALTAAHKTLPMPVNVRVTNLENGKSLIVRVNDRGPYARGRIIDLSKRAAELLDVVQTGTARVRVTYISRADINGSPPEETPPAVANALPAAPAGKVDSAGHRAGCGGRSPGPPRKDAHRAYPGTNVRRQPAHGPSDAGSRAGGDASLCPAGRFLQDGQCQGAARQGGGRPADFHPSTGRTDPL
jgi:rare lipoprotein A